MASSKSKLRDERGKDGDMEGPWLTCFSTGAILDSFGAFSLGTFSTVFGSFLEMGLFLKISAIS